MKKNLILLIILLAFFIGFYLNKLVSEKKINDALQETKKVEQELKKIRQEKNEAEAIKLNANKTKSLENIASGSAYFTYQTKILTNNQVQVDIYLNGSQNGAADAADLVLDLSDNLEVKEINKGDAFALYPRLIIDKNIITISGLTVVADGKFQFGKLNNLFISLILEKKSGPGSFINLDQKNSKVFFLGQSIMEYQKSFSRIKL